MSRANSGTIEYRVLDQSKEPIAIIDLYISTIWTERYRDTGDFELRIPLDSAYLECLKLENYLAWPKSDRTMIIESVQVESNIDTGEKFALFKGRSLESLLDRRIIWGSRQYNDKVENIIEDLIIRNAIRPSNSKRIIPNLVLARPDVYTQNYLETLSNVECQLNGDNLLESVKVLCEQVNLGFKITLSSSGELEFRLYYGVDRTAEQSDREPVVFSTELDTLISSRYIADISEYRNTILVSGEETNNVPIYAEAYASDSEPEGLDRREMYTQASDLRQADFGANYTSALQYRGLTELQKKSTMSVFDAEAETSIGPQYGKEYFLGDFVTLKNEYNIQSSAQITEYIRSCDEKGYSEYPTFVIQN